MLKHRHILSPLIKSQLPEHMVFDFDKFDGMSYSKFVSLIEHYYKWLEKEYEANIDYFKDVIVDELKAIKIVDVEPDTGSVYKQLLKLQQYRDIDHTAFSMLKMFNAEYASSMPADLLVDRSKLIKNIRDFYQSKGSEKSFEFLFRILFDSVVELEYPRDNVLIASGGVWNIPYSLRVIPPLETEANKTTIDDISNMEGYIIKGTSSNATTIITSIRVIKGDVTYCELFIDNSETRGEFEGNENVIFIREDNSIVKLDNGSDPITGTLLSGIESVEIVDGGYGFSENQEISVGWDSNKLEEDGSYSIVEPDLGTGAVLSVDKLGKGSIEGVRIIDSGSGYSKFDPVFVVKDYFLVYDLRITEGYIADDLIGLRVVGNKTKNVATIRQVDINASKIWFDEEETTFKTDENEGRWFGGELVYSENEEVTFRIVKVVKIEGYGTDILAIDVDSEGKITEINVVDGGNGFEYLPAAYVKSETLAEDGTILTRGRGAKIQLTSKSVGSIKVASVKSLGVGYKKENEKQYSIPADVNFKVGVIQKYPGSAGGSSNLSGMSKIHDGVYYQNYSYVIKTDIPSSEWKDVVKKLIHPAGTRMFSSVAIRLKTVLPFSFKVPEKTLTLKKHIDYRQIVTYGYQRNRKTGSIQDINEFAFTSGSGGNDPIFFSSGGPSSGSGLSFNVNETEQILLNPDSDPPINAEELSQNSSLEFDASGSISFTKNLGLRDGEPVLGKDSIGTEFSHTWPTLRADVGETSGSDDIGYYYQGRDFPGIKLLLGWERKVFPLKMSPTAMEDRSDQEYTLIQPPQPILYHLDLGVRFPETQEDDMHGPISYKPEAILHTRIRQSRLDNTIDLFPRPHIIPELYGDATVDLKSEVIYQIVAKEKIDKEVHTLRSRVIWPFVTDATSTPHFENELTYELYGDVTVESKSEVVYQIVAKEKIDKEVHTLRSKVIWAPWTSDVTTIPHVENKLVYELNLDNSVKDVSIPRIVYQIIAKENIDKEVHTLRSKVIWPFVTDATLDSHFVNTPLSVESKSENKLEVISSTRRTFKLSTFKTEAGVDFEPLRYKVMWPSVTNAEISSYSSDSSLSYELKVKSDSNIVFDTFALTRGILRSFNTNELGSENSIYTRKWATSISLPLDNNIQTLVSNELKTKVSTNIFLDTFQLGGDILTTLLTSGLKPEDSIYTRKWWSTDKLPLDATLVFDRRRYPKKMVDQDTCELKSIEGYITFDTDKRIEVIDTFGDKITDSLLVLKGQDPFEKLPLDATLIFDRRRYPKKMVGGSTCEIKDTFSIVNRDSDVVPVNSKGPEKEQDDIPSGVLTLPVESMGEFEFDVKKESIISFASHRRPKTKFTRGINSRERFTATANRYDGKFIIDYLKYSTIAGYASVDVGGLNENHVSLGVDDTRDVLFLNSSGESVGLRTGEKILPFQTSNMIEDNNSVPFQILNRLDNAGPAEEQYEGQGYEEDGQVGIELGDTFYINNNGVKEQATFAYSMEANESLTTFGRRKQFPGQVDFIDDVSGDNNNTTYENFKTVDHEVWNEELGKIYMPDGYVRSFRVQI